MRRNRDEHSLFARIVEDIISSIIVFALCCFLIKLGISYLVAVRVPLIIISVILATIFIIYRVCKWRDHDDYY